MMDFSQFVRRHYDWLFIAGLILIALFLSIPGLKSSAIVEQDAASHLMDGVFFRDFISDFPIHDIKSYPLRYYAQYPALGFLFWPPFFPFIEGLFFLAGGISIPTALLSIFFFACILICSMYFCIRNKMSAGLTFLTVLSVLTVKDILLYLNLIMLEIPSLAMMFLAVYLYTRIIKKTGQQSLSAWFLLAFVASLSLYTKQTCIIALLAIFIDMAVNHKKLFKTFTTYIAIAFFIFLILPLAVYTLKFGHANIAQSFGNQTNLIMQNYNSLSRWTIQNWLYYPTIFFTQMNGILFLGAISGIVYSFFNKSFFRENILWLSWIFSFYLLFSYFDNKAERFAILCTPPCCN